MNPLICIAGPTASGKTALSIALAQAIDAEIISCDSMQVYRGMDIGTAKPTVEERRGIPHYMLDVADPTENFSVSRFCRMATPLIDDILRRGKTAILAGGTGLYMDALIRGNEFAPCPTTGRREELEALADREGIAAVMDRLRDVDPQSAARLPLSDRKRIIRAMEVYLETGQTITAHNERTKLLPPRYTPLWLGLEDADRAALYKRIDRRVAAMLDAGLLQEIRTLLDSGVPKTATAMQAIGYKEFVAALEGQCTLEQAAQQVCTASRHYAKRQLTWFRRNKAIHWLRREDGMTNGDIFAQARRILHETDK